METHAEDNQKANSQDQPGQHDAPAHRFAKRQF
jgi:hypothetical protein